MISEPDKGVYDAMNKGFASVQGRRDRLPQFRRYVPRSTACSATSPRRWSEADIVYGDLNMVTDHRTKRLVRVWRGGTFRRYSFQLGWVPPHPTFYMRRQVAEKVGDYDLSYITTADYDYMLRAMALTISGSRYLRGSSSISRWAASAPAAGASPSAAIWNACARAASI